MPNRARGGRRNRAPTISAMADCNLPREVMAEILSRLPVKSIIRFRCVCKPFLSLLSSPNFIKTHLARTSQDPQNASLVVHSISIHYKHVMTLFRIGSIETPITPAHPFSQSRVDMDLVGSINGLVCLCSPPLGSTMVLWNPATKQWKEIPLPKKEPRTDKIDQVSLGFGFDYASNDFKVIRIVSIKPKTKLLSRVFAYSANAESWEEIKVDFPFSVTATRSNGIAKGTPYWTGVVKQGTDEREVIISFDVKSEVFTVWPVLNFSLNKATTLRVVNFKDSLATIVYSPGRVPNELVDFHILDENSCAWRKIHTVGPVPLEVNRMCQCFINGEIVIENNDGKLFLYDPKSQVVKSLQIDDAQGLSYEAFCYTESLVAVKGMKPVEDRKGQETRNRDDFLSKGFKLRL